MPANQCFGSPLVLMRIWIHNFRPMLIRIQRYDDQQFITICSRNKINVNSNLLISRPPIRTSKLQEKPSFALKREHPALQNFKKISSIFVCYFWPPGSGADPCGSGSEIRQPPCFITDKSLILPVPQFYKTTQVLTIRQYLRNPYRIYIIIYISPEL